MSTPDTATLLTQLRTVLDLTDTEIEIAEAESPKPEPTPSDANYSRTPRTPAGRAEAIDAAIRDLGGIPELIGPLLGRAAAAVKTARRPWFG